MPHLHDNPALAIPIIVILGAVAQWLAWRVRLPAILPLLLIGFIIGPVLNLIKPTELLGGDLLFSGVSLAVGLILFEGGLTLRLSEAQATGVVRRLITIGALATWIGATFAAWLIAGLPLTLAFLFGALIIVTGPTVIGPLLRNIRPTKQIGSVLRWEGVLIDPIGAVVAVLVFEFLLIDNRGEALGQTVLLLARMILAGGVTGLAGGLLLSSLLRRRLLPDYLVSVVSLALVFAAFSLSNQFAGESGLLATTLMGLVTANRRVPNIQELLDFKETLSTLLISVLFIILAAETELEALVGALSWRNLLTVLVIMVVVRPLTVFTSSLGSPLSLREKLFLSWIAPRGIVAASISALFAFELTREGHLGAEVLEPLVFLVIIGTIVLNSLTAKPLARLLELSEPNPQGFLILGAHAFARSVARLLEGEGVSVVLADTNWANVAKARIGGLSAYYGSPLSDRSDDELQLSGIGHLLALTSNDEANALAALKYAREFGTGRVFQLSPTHATDERQTLSVEQRGRLLFRPHASFPVIERLRERGAEIRKTEITDKFTLADFERLYGDDVLILFTIQSGSIVVVTEELQLPAAGTALVTLSIEPKSGSLKP